MTSSLGRPTPNAFERDIARKLASRFAKRAPMTQVEQMTEIAHAFAGMREQILGPLERLGDSDERGSISFDSEEFEGLLAALRGRLDHFETTSGNRRPLRLLTQHRRRRVLR